MVDTSPIVEDLACPDQVTEIEVIADWEDRMNRASYNDHQRDVIARVLSKKQDFADILGGQGWVN